MRMDRRLVTASLAPELAPRRYKFTSEQGRSRRTRLLAAARELLREQPPESITIADVCKLAEIPRPSAYHFFPNIDAIFLGIRLMHAETILGAASALDEEVFEDWPDYISRLIDVGVEVTRGEPAFLRLVYGYGVSYAEIRKLGQNLDARIAELAWKGMQSRFHAVEWETREQVFAVAFSIVDALLKLSYRRDEDLMPWAVAEAKLACLSYLRNYLPEISRMRRMEPA